MVLQPRTTLSVTAALHEFDLVAKSSAVEYADAVRHARLIAQNLEAYSPGSGWTTRDEFMAENIVRIINALPADSRVVVWAHNGHIEKAEPSGTSKPMGAVLASIYGERYYALGFAFNQGSFQARSMDPKAKFALSPFVLGAAPEKSIEWYFAMPGIPIYIVDFRHTGRNPAVSRWLSKTHPMRIFGATSAGATDPLGQVNPVKQFDGMLFIDKTARARPNPSVPNVAR